MSNNKEKIIIKNKIEPKRLIIMALFLVYDVLAVYFSFCFAFILRFYVANQFHEQAYKFLNTYNHYAPVYVIFCIIIFAVYRLYDGTWKYAGFSDFNRIIIANIICFVGHVAGTLIFHHRMPITFYCLGAVIQLIAILVSRFGLSFILLERDRLFKGKTGKKNAMLIGVGGTSRMVLSQLRRDNVFEPRCVLNYSNTDTGSMYDGVPVINGMDNFENAVKKYDIEYVMISSFSLPKNQKDLIYDKCKELEIETLDYTKFYDPAASGLTLRSLSEACSSPVDIIMDGKHQNISDNEDLLSEKKYKVCSVAADGGTIVVELAEKRDKLNDINEEWVKKQVQETGEDVSFF